MKLKLFNKYFFTTASIILMTFLIMVLILSFVLNNYIARSKETTLQNACDKVCEYVDLELAENEKVSQQEFYTVLNSIASVSQVDVFVANKRGKVIACGCAEWQKNGNCSHSSVLIPKDEVELYLNQSDKSRLGTLNMYENPHYITASPLTQGEGGRYGTVFATAPVAFVTNLLSTITKLFITCAIIPLIFMFLVLYAMTYRMTKPLKLMAEASRAMAKGDFSKRIPVMSDDEIGELSVAFNQMTNSLSQLEGMRKSFVANVSHELKTPMTTISGFIDGVLDGTIEPEKQSYYLGIVSGEVKRLSRLVESMLSMSKLESGEFNLKPEIFDLSELLRSVVLSQEQRIEKGQIDIKGLDTLTDISVNGDRDLIHQAIYNLVDNAIKFNRQGGEIAFALYKEANNSVLTISNTGAGIPKKDLPYVFERFYKVDKSRSAEKNSTGIGLYIVKTVITAHKGTISVASKENEYTTFKITLRSI